MSREVFTAGHSTRSAEELVALFAEAGVTRVVDVRRYPVSRRFPQHSRERLRGSLEAAGVGYAFLGDALGGRLEPTTPPEASPNGAWREPSLRAFADALDTPELRAGLAALESLAAEQPSAVLCAERDWRSCHRQIVADALAARGWRVMHLLRPGEREPHRLHASARIDAEGRLSYPSLV
ncbi:MAG TPA: DUF488 domain-containing protein [Myxococcota bacterium]|nr:DUF488 domain-containing protein [Myxococcota bacterium]